jgi:hypothetical protein
LTIAIFPRRLQFVFIRLGSVFGVAGFMPAPSVAGFPALNLSVPDWLSVVAGYELCFLGGTLKPLQRDKAAAQIMVRLIA